MQTTDRTEPERTADRLVVLVPLLRAAIQRSERAPPEARSRSLTVPLHTHAPGCGVLLSTSDARTLLRAVLPAALAISPRTTRRTLGVADALAAWHTALIGLTNPDLTDAAIEAAVTLADALTSWIAGARWQQATRRAGVAWPQPREQQAISAVMQQSTAPAPKRTENTRTTKRPMRGQTALLLPLAGGQTPTDATLAQPARRTG